MGFLRRFYRRPQALGIRRAVFQVHLWVGVILAIYMIVIGVTGSVLVLEGELERLVLPQPWRNVSKTAARADIAVVIGAVQTAYPHWRLISLTAPNRYNPGFVAVLQGRSRIRVGLDPATGAVLGEFTPNPRWLRFIEELHETLLLRGQGRLLNGVGGAFLVLLCATGIVIWWPGVQHWRRGLMVDFRRSWRRINFDLHSAVAFWSLLLIAFWGISGIYFAWPRQVFAVVNAVSPIINSKPPKVTVVPQDGQADIGALIGLAARLDPNTTWKGVQFPFSQRAPLEVLMARRGGEGREYEDIVYFNPYTGEHLATWRYGVNQTFGDWVIWAQAPMHFGNSWGLGVKIVWAIAGLAIPLLAVTGLLMYWNRTLRRKWKHLQQHHESTHGPTRRSVMQSVPAILMAGPGVRIYVVGSTATGVPFSFLDLKTNQPRGAMIEIARAIAADAGFSIEVRMTAFSALIPSLTAHKIDVISAGMLRTAAREKVVSFSQPVFSYGGGLVVPGRDQKEYRTIADLKGMTVGVQVGTRFYDQLQASGAGAVKTYDNLMDMLMDLSTRRIEAAYGDAPIFAYQMAQARMRAARLVKSFRPPSVEDVCLVVRKDDRELLDRINASVMRMRDKKIRAILAQWSLN